MSRRLTACATLILAAAALSACGKAGQLERPGPLFGKPGTAPVADDANRRDPTRPMTTIDPRDRSTDATTAPSRTDPIPGQSPDPLGSSPRGVLPDPYANPQ